MAYPTTELIDALRTAADKIESGEWKYGWYSSRKCNCGLVARAIVGETVKSPVSTWNDFKEGLNQYPQRRSDICLQSGFTYKELYDRLTDAGLTNEDFEELERLSNESVVKSMSQSASDVDYTVRSHVIEYLRTWADLLETARTMIHEESDADLTESDAEDGENTADPDGPTLDELLQYARNASTEEVTTALNKIGYDFN
jgi:hypothetical protein